MSIDFDVKDYGGNVNGLLSIVTTMDWGIILSEWQGSCEVFLVGQSNESAARLLREAADALEALPC